MQVRVTEYRYRLTLNPQTSTVGRQNHTWGGV